MRFRLPEWCIYVETPGLSYVGSKVQGFWCHLEYDMNSNRSELRFLLNTNWGRIPVPLHLGDWTIQEAVERAIALAKKNMSRFGMKGDGIDYESGNLTETMAEAISPFVSIVIYICSDKPEIADERLPGASPQHVQPLRTKKG